MPRVIGGSYGGGRFLMGEVPLYKSVNFGAEVPGLTELVNHERDWDRAAGVPR